MSFKTKCGFVVMIMFLEMNTFADACPMQCVCKWKNGKQSAICSGKDLSSIPKSLDTELQVLDISKNNLQTLHREIFQKLGLLNLQKVFMSQCRLQKIDDHAFKGLSNLVELDLSENYIFNVPYENFVYLSSLMRLTLSENPITKIKSQMFHHLMHLNTLEMSYCKLDMIEPDAFAGLAHLETLKLDGNKLKSIKGDTILPDTLRGVDLQNNDWECDCEMQDLHAWLLNFNIPHNVEPVCVRPERLAGKTIKSIKQDDLACLPNVTPTKLYLEMEEGKNISLECHIVANPQATLLWLYNGQLLRNDTNIAPGLHFVYYTEEGTREKSSSLYIYNADSQDNGTYSCLAENPAGSVQSNYTIRIFVKEPPKVVVVSFPQKYMIVLSGSVCLIGALLLTIITVCIVKCRKDSKRRKKKESGIDVAMQNESNSRKTISSDTDNMNSSIPKVNGSLMVNTEANSVLHYPLSINHDFSINVQKEMVFSPNSLSTYVENNPDIIHDAAESIERKNDFVMKSDGNYPIVSLPMTFNRQVHWQDQPRAFTNPMGTLPRGLPKDCFLQKVECPPLRGYYVDNDGYPLDFGLPKAPSRVNSVLNINANPTTYCQTLPYKKGRRHSQYAKDIKFNTTATTFPYVCSGANVRYTLEGYPYRKENFQTSKDGGVQCSEINFVPSPPEEYKSDPVHQSTFVNDSIPCILQVDSPIVLTPTCCHVQTRCVNTQTSNCGAWPASTSSSSDNAPKLPQVSTLDVKRETSTESPDEGYVGDGIETADI